MADQKISQLPNASTLTGTEAVPVVQGSATVQTPMSAVRGYAVSDLASTYGIATNSRNVPDMTATAVNTSQFGRMLAGATGGNGSISAFVTLPIDGTPSVAFLAATLGRLWVGHKATGTATPTWREFAPLDTPTFTTRVGIGSGNANVGLNVVPLATGTVLTGAIVSPNIQTDVTGTVYGVVVTPNAAAGSQVIASIRPYTANIGTIAGTTTVTNVYGYIADSSLGTQAAIGSAYGYYSTIVAGTNRWQLFMQGSANSYFGGPVGLGTTSIGGTTGFTGLRVDRNITGTASGNITHVRSAGTIQSDVTGTAAMNDTFVATQATAFTLSSLIHYRAVQGNIGAGGSAVTSQNAFVADASLIGASFNIGFRGQIPSGTNRWNMYMDGTAANYINGFTGFGTLNPLVAVQIGGDATYREFRTMRSGDNANANVITLAKSRGTESAQTAVVANDTLGSIYWNGNDGSGSTVGAVKNAANIAALVDGSVSTSIVPGRIVFSTTDTAGTTAERMRINNTGNVGIGTGSLGATTLVVGKNITGGTSAFGIRSNGVIQSDATGAGSYYRTDASTQAASGFICADIYHFQAAQGTFGAGSTVTAQSGFRADSTLTGATNNYGFYGNIPSGTGRWNLYMSGTASNYIAGALGLGTTTITAQSLTVANNITGGTIAYGIRSTGVVQSDVTTGAYYHRTAAATAASFTLPTLVHYQASQGTFNGTVTIQSGFAVDSNMTGAATNYGFFGNLASGSNRYNLYMGGTAQNFFLGNVGIGTGKSVPTCALDVNGLVAQSTANTLTAAGTNLATALALTAAYNVVTSAAAGTGVSLPDVVGARIWIFNNQGTNAINVYPPNGSATINGGAAGAAVSLAANGKMQYVQVATNVWYTMS